MATTTGDRQGRSARRWSFPIGRVAGIQLRVHATFFLLPLLFLVPSESIGAFASGMLWLAVVFACVVVHELAHSLLALRRGGEVRAITLLPIGGVSEIERMPEDPRDELHIAVAGPLASIALAALAAGAALAVGHALWPVDMASGSWLARLAWFNLAVGLFNLVPAFPLDGGRVLRAALQQRSDLETATRRAAGIGRVIGMGLVGLGLFYDVWLAIIGLFVFFGASAEESGTVVRARLSGLRVADAMKTDPVTVAPVTPGGWMVHIGRRAGQEDLPVVEADRYVGLVALAAAVNDRDAVASALADTDAPTLSPDDELEEALRLLSHSGHGSLPVLDGERVVGLLRGGDVSRFLRDRPPVTSAAEDATA